MNELSRGVRIWAELFFILLQSMRLSDGRTDGQTDGFLVAIPCVALHAVAR